VDIDIRAADFSDPVHCDGIIDVLDSYASDPVGGGVRLPPDVRQRLVPALRDHPTASVLLALAAGRPVGVAVCFFGLSTFQARPLLNIHDLAIVPEWRGKGVGRALLDAVEAAARGRGCCKITLEVQDDNIRARALYARCGFTDFVIGNSGPTRFLSKPLGSQPPQAQRPDELEHGRTKS
jgi:GNAT superfamily N-acetyltransferase